MLFIIFPLSLLIFYLSLIFVSLIYCVSWVVFPWVSFAWDSLCFLDLVDYFLSHVREVFNYYLSPNIFSGPFSFPSGTSMQIFVHFMLSHRSVLLASFLFILFSVFCFAALIFTILCSRSFVVLLLQVFYY